MTGTLRFVAVILAMCGNAHGAVRITENISAEAGKIHTTGTQVTEISASRMRVEARMGDNTTVTIYDLDSAREIALNPEKREATVRPFTEMRQLAEKSVAADATTSNIIPTGAPRTVNGIRCQPYKFTVRVKVVPDGKPTLVVAGVACIAARAAGVQEYRDFVASGVQHRLLIGYRNNNLVFVALAYAETELSRIIGQIGIPMESDRDIRFEGGMFAALLNRSSGHRSTETVSVSEDSVADTAFQIPAGWKVQQER